MFKNIRGLLGFSKSEMNAVLILVPIILLFVFFPTMYRLTYKVEYDRSSDQKLLDSLLIQLRKSEETEDHLISYFKFDPNELSVDSLKLLGIPVFLANRIDHYRLAGGQFRVPSDLNKIYDFPDTLFEELQSWVEIKSASATNIHPKSVIENVHSSRDENKSSALETDIKFVVSKEEVVHLNLNDADTTAFKQLRGIGTVYANRIVKYRALLGGFHDPAQIREVYGISDSLYQQILPSLHIDRPPELTKLAINLATFKSINAHPYISYEQTKEIFEQKSRIGKYKSAADLLKLKLFDSAQVLKVLPYLDFR